MAEDEQRRVNMLALSDSLEKVHLQSLRKRAGGAVVSAITGLGKSTLVERVLSVLAPEQFVTHGASKECGWSLLTQVAYLIVNAPSNATRKGMFSAIVGALDALLGTDYSSDLKRQNLDQAMVFVAKKLSIHRVGLLVIDENQASTLAENVWGFEFILYFLGLMNLGVPVVLMGSPLAFTELEAGAQLTRRFATHGWHVLHPGTIESDSWWHHFLVGVTRFRLCEEIPSIDETKLATAGIDAGVPGIFLPIWKEAQKIALRRGGQASCLKIGDLQEAGSSPTVQKLLEVGKAISTDNVKLSFDDLPRPKKFAEQADGAKPPADPGDARQAYNRVAAGLKQRERRAQLKAEREKAAQRNLTEDDMRRRTDALAKFASSDTDQGELEV